MDTPTSLGYIYPFPFIYAMHHDSTIYYRYIGVLNIGWTYLLTTDISSHLPFDEIAPTSNFKTLILIQIMRTVCLVSFYLICLICLVYVNSYYSIVVV